MRRLRASIGLRYSCVEGAESSCCVHRLIPTESIIRIELEQQTYADSNRVHEPATDCPEYRISGLEALLEGAPILPDPKPLWHRALQELLDGTREGLKHPCRGSLRSETEINSRAAQSNRRVGKVERSDGSRRNVDRRECRELNSKSRHRSLSKRKFVLIA